MTSRFLLSLLVLSFVLISCSKATQSGDMPGSILRKIQRNAAEKYYDRMERRAAIQKQIIAYHEIYDDKEARIPPEILKEMRELAFQKNPDNYVFQTYTYEAQKEQYLRHLRETNDPPDSKNPEMEPKPVEVQSKP